jgi:hypothetical protein
LRPINGAKPFRNERPLLTLTMRLQWRIRRCLHY